MKNTKNLLNDFGVAFFEKLGYLLNPVILKFKNEKKQLLVFYFHGLFKSAKEKELNYIDPQNNMTVDAFSDFIDYFLFHNYKFIKPDDLISGLEDNRPYAMITFDDGYFNNLRAIEILTQYKIPGIFFISTRNIMENKAYWWDIIYKYRIKQGNSLENIRHEQRSLKSFKYSYINDYILKAFGMEAFTPCSDLARPFNRDEIKQLATNPYVVFGNHTHNHSILINYNKNEVKEELNIANKILFDLTGTLPIAIAFPNGNYNQMVLEATEEEGFRYAFTIEPAINLFPIPNNKFTILNRYMTDTTKINKYGGACRIGYRPHVLYDDLKTKAKLILNQNKTT
jgi:peptidoglycan/xylan/chitin deacetylase (PgdA/CDA1 family)